MAREIQIWRNDESWGNGTSSSLRSTWWWYWANSSGINAWCQFPKIISAVIISNQNINRGYKYLLYRKKTQMTWPDYMYKCNKSVAAQETKFLGKIILKKSPKCMIFIAKKFLFFTLSADLRTTMSPAGCSHGSPSTCTGISVLVLILMWLP